MRVFFYGCVSLDGYLADKHHNLDWLHATGSVEETGYDDFYRQMDITIMGKRTYDEIKDIKNVNHFYATTTNYVFTHSDEQLVEGFIKVNQDVVEFVRSCEKDKNIWVIGGNTILGPLLDKDMVDCMYLQIAPVLLGEGISLFTQKEGKQRYHLKEVNKYGEFAELVYEK